MAGLVQSIEELVGRTPLMELDHFERQQQCGAHLLAKLEFFNPTGSVKDRAALSMLNAAGGRTVSGHIGSSGFARSGAGGPQTGESGKEHRGHRPGQRHEISVYADVPAEKDKNTMIRLNFEKIA